jgi:predicted aspartyl protease
VLPNKILRIAFYVGLAVAGAIGASARSPISLDVLRRDGYGSVQLIKAGKNTLLVPTEINGVKGNLLLDTGFAAAGITVGFSPAKMHIVPQKGVRGMSGASGAAFVAVGHGIAQSIVIGDVHIKEAPIFFGAFHREGFVGCGFLRTNNAIIDLTNLKMYLRPPGRGRPVNLSRALGSIGMAEAPFDVASDGHFIANVTVNGVAARMALDTGAQATEIDARFARQASAQRLGRRNVRRIDVTGVVSSADLAGTKALAIGGIPVRAPTVLVTNFAPYTASGGRLVGILGLDVIGQNWGIIDFGRQKFYFARAK